MSDFDAGHDESSQQIDIPDPVRGFYRSLLRHLSSRNIYQLHQLYETDFPKLSERYYPDSSWPTPEQIRDSVEEDDGAASSSSGLRHAASLLYRDLYYRHIYSKLTVDVDDRIESFHASIELFHAILSMSNDQLLLAAQREKGGKGGKKGDRDRGDRGRGGGDSKSDEADDAVFELPVNWLWDLVDEFVYQFESFSLFRSRSSSKLTQDELQVVADNPDVWDAHTVLRYLHAMVRKAGIEVNAAQPAAAAAGIASFFSTLGHFALVGLLRVHVLLCDYASALQVLAPLDLKLHKTLLSSVPSCYLSLYYHLGYAYLMLHRYVDALRILSYYVVYKQRNKHVQHKLSSTPSMQSRLDRLQGLLALAFAVSPDTLDDAVLSELKDKHGDRWQRLQRFDLTVFEDVFFQCAPKALLLSPQPQSASASASSAASSPFSQTPHELRQQQWLFFSQDVLERSRLPPLLSYLKLFSSVSLAKLAAHIGSNEDEALALLLMHAGKAEQERWTGGGAGEGRRVLVTELEMRLDGERVEMSKEQQQRRYGEFFVRQIARMEEIQKEVIAGTSAPASATGAASNKSA